MQYNQKSFVDPKDAKRYAGSSDPSKDWSEHLGVGMYAVSYTHLTLPTIYSV